MVAMVWHGVDEMRRELRTLPRDLRDDAAPYVRARATAVGAAIAAAYPARSGALQRGVTVQINDGGTAAVGARITNTAPHAALYEKGSAPRFTRRGAYRGIMRARPTFVPRMQAYRRGLQDDMAQVMTARGLTVRR
jgi:hypothetical protein